LGACFYTNEILMYELFIFLVPFPTLRADRGIEAYLVKRKIAIVVMNISLQNLL
jgi:hypothetical protein